MDNEKKQVTYNSSITGETQVTFDIQQYMNNRAMFIGLMCNEDGYEEPFGDVTVNLSVAAPNYCGYLNVNDMKNLYMLMEVYETDANSLLAIDCTPDSLDSRLKWLPADKQDYLKKTFDFMIEQALKSA